MEISIYEKTGEFYSVLDFTKKSVDLNKLKEHLLNSCHCVWVESDFESYVKVYGFEKNCVVDVINNMSKEIED